MTRLVALLPLCVLVALPAPAQTVDEIVAKNIEARGGLARLQAIESVRITSRVPFGPQPRSVFEETPATRGEAVVVYEAKGADKRRRTLLVSGFTQRQYEQAVRNDLADDKLLTPDGQRIRQMLIDAAARSDFSNPNVSTISAYDGTTGWMWNSEQRTVLTAPSDYAASGFGFVTPLVDQAKGNRRVELDGRGKAEGKNCYKLRLTDEAGVAVTLYIDAATYLDVVIEGKLPIRSLSGQSKGDVSVRTVFRDWKSVDGVMVPHLILTSSGGGPNRRETVDKVEFNVPLDDRRFSPPQAR